MATGLPLQRPLFLDYEADAACWGVDMQYGYGADLVVAPVTVADARAWDAYLPAGADWVHLWSGTGYAGGAAVTVAAPLGEPPVFYRAGSAHAALFAGIASL